MNHYQIKYRLPARPLLVKLLVGLFIFNILTIILHLVHWWPLRLGLILYLSLVPGGLILWQLGLKQLDRLTHVMYAVGLSLVWLMFTGLAVNQMGPQVGVARPLESAPLLVGFNLSLVLLMGLAAWRQQPLCLNIKWPWRRHSGWFMLWASLLPLIIALGAFRLNNLASASVSMLGLGLTLGLVAVLLWRQRNWPDYLLVYCLMNIGLAVLLMTSLRGWEVVGHDIKREFQVFSLAQQLGHWDMSVLHSAYNACLSITILPLSLSKILDVSGLVVFKFLFQILFSLTPVIVFYILKNHVSRAMAVLGSLLFIAYPTFVNDSAMLTRQEIAFVFFGLQLLVWFDKDPAIRSIWRSLFLLFGAGLIVSHYSSAYFLVAVLVISYGLYRVWSILAVQRFRESKTLTGTMVLLICLGTTLWYAQLTFTATGLTDTLSESFKNIAHTFSDDNKSSDASASLFFATQKSRRQLFYKYAEQTRQQQGSPTDNLTIQLADSGTLPLTNFGSWLHRISHHDPGNLLVTLRQSYARFLQILAIVGTFGLLYRSFRRSVRPPPESLVVLSVASLILLLAMVILPSISLDYGLLRAFQQTAFYLLIPIMICLGWLFKPLGRWAATASNLFVVAILLLFLGVLSQLIGGVDAPLALNNQGFIYGTFYTHPSDIAGFGWLSSNVKPLSTVAAVDFANATLYQPTFNLRKRSLTRSADYLYLNHSNVVQYKIFQYFNGESLTTTLPADYYTKDRNLIYSTSQSQLWAQPQ